MMCIPVKVSDELFDIFIILEEDNIKRIKTYDPAEVVKDRLGIPWKQLKLRNIIIGYATTDDLLEFQKFIAIDNLLGGLKFLSRGWIYRPDHGDSDRLYQSLRNRKEHES